MSIALKDRVALTVAILAFLLSVLSIYLQYRSVDNLRARVLKYESYAKQEDSVVCQGVNVAGAIVNRGSEQAVVMSLGCYLTDKQNSYYLKREIAGFPAVIQPGEIRLFNAGFVLAEYDRSTVGTEPEADATTNTYALIFEVLDSEGKEHTVARALFRATSGRTLVGTPEMLDDAKTPEFSLFN